MKFIQITFKGVMVRQMLAGLKSMTRRLQGLDEINEHPDDWVFTGADGVYYYFQRADHSKSIQIKCPYGQPGDVLWVRESFFAYGHWTSITDTMMPQKTEWRFNDLTLDFVFGPENRAYLYFDNPPASGTKKKGCGQIGWFKRPSLFMPKEACRLWGKVKAIRPERLQDISKEDAKAEGIGRWIEDQWSSKPEHYQVYFQDTPEDPATYTSCPINSFETLWQSINGPESWNANPWVWVVEFEVCTERPEGFLDEPAKDGPGTHVDRSALGDGKKVFGIEGETENQKEDEIS